ncbi:hypothetical protein Glove_139g90 [Diversispora epigaea]|uniref:Uncharacterized protein n=1 Tax=Diversispora epigaea TaxID=1348612 RepID=A0A397IVM2_9GLOM|nr:hypothetical protein Glove_139g90 [Diversispora epigaea]
MKRRLNNPVYSIQNNLQYKGSEVNCSIGDEMFGEYRLLDHGICVDLLNINIGNNNNNITMSCGSPTTIISSTNHLFLSSPSLLSSPQDYSRGSSVGVGGGGGGEEMVSNGNDITLPEHRYSVSVAFLLIKIFIMISIIENFDLFSSCYRMPDKQNVTLEYLEYQTEISRSNFSCT